MVYTNSSYAPKDECTVAQREREVPNAMQRLEQAIESQSKITTLVVERLAVFLLPSPETISNNKREGIYASGFAKQLESYTNKVASSTESLTMLLDRLEI